MSKITLRTLGALDLRAADGRELHTLLAQPKRIALLAYLCIAEPTAYHRRDTLLGLLWPNADEEHARASLRKSLHILRKSLGEDAILGRGDDEVKVNTDMISCDVVEFRQLVRQKRYEEALEIYRGDLLPGFIIDEAPDFDQWLESERSQLRRDVVVAGAKTHNPEIPAEDSGARVSAAPREKAGISGEPGNQINEADRRAHRRDWRSTGSFLLGAIAVVLLIAIVGWRVSAASRRPLEVVRYTLAIDSAEAIAPATPWSGRIAISPDGSHFAYVGGPREQLFIRPRNELHARPVPRTNFASTPFFSPDGRSVGFLTERAIHIVTLGSDQVVDIADSLSGIAGGSWGSDGFIYTDGYREAPLARVRATAGSPASWFTTLDTANAEIDHTWPEVLPNGKGVVFTVTFDPRKKPGQATFALAVADIPTGKHRVIIQDALYPRYVDGRLFYLTPGRTLMVVPFDQNSMKVAGPSRALIQGMRVGRMGSADLAISANGTLVYSVGAEQFGQTVVWVSRDGTQTHAAPDWQGLFIEPALSPDGKSLAVTRSLDGRTGDIWVRNLDRGTSIKLTHEGVMNRGATWTPDGSSVTYTEANPNGDFELRTAHADGTGSPRLELHTNAVLYTPKWTPDGKWLLSANLLHVGGSDILGIRPGIDTTPVRIVATKATESEIAVSKDGRWLAYDSDESGRDEIYVVPFPHTDSAKWAITSGGGNAALWSHSGRELFYRGPSGDMFSVAVTTSPRFSVGKAKKLFAAPYDDFPAFEGNDVDLDDKRFLMVRQLRKEQPDKFVVVENWLEELRATKN